jgi:hypothetical protein
MFNAAVFDALGSILIDFGVCGDEHLTGEWITDILCREAPDDAVNQRFDDFTAFDEGTDLNGVNRSAIELNRDHILSNIYQASGQIS